MGGGGGLEGLEGLEPPNILAKVIYTVLMQTLDEVYQTNRDEWIEG